MIHIQDASDQTLFVHYRQIKRDCEDAVRNVANADEAMRQVIHWNKEDFTVYPTAGGYKFILNTDPRQWILVLPTK